MSNLPDDWACYWATCPEHDVKYHMSESCPICEIGKKEQEQWVDDRDRAIEAEAESRYYDEKYPDWEPMDHPDW